MYLGRSGRSRAPTAPWVPICTLGAVDDLVPQLHPGISVGDSIDKPIEIM